MAKNKTEKESFSEVMERLNKVYGEGAIRGLNDSSEIEYDVISTGSIGFDYGVLGAGGVVKGKLVELIGWEGTGKSTLCGHLTANCQRDGGKVLYIDGEHAVDKKYFEALGVDTDALLLSQPSTGEEGFNIALEMIKTGEIDLVIIDSDSSLLPKSVVEGDIGDSAIGKKAKLNNDAYPKIKTALSKHNVTVIVISQYREKIGVMFGDPRTTQGGHALKFYSDCRIEISKSLSKDNGEIIGNTTKVKTIKCKWHPPYRETKFDIAFGIGIDKKKEIMDLCKELGIGRKYGQTFTLGETKYSLEEFYALIEDPISYNDIRTKILLTLNENN